MGYDVDQKVGPETRLYRNTIQQVKQMRHEARYRGVLRMRAYFVTCGISLLCAVSLAEPVPTTSSEAKALAVPTFHCLGVYWSPEGGDSGKKVSVKYRASGQRKMA